MTTPAAMPLTAVSQGDSVTIVEVRANERLRRRLGDLGLNAGMSLRVLADSRSDPMILAVTNDSRLAIERSVAQKIMVTVVSSQ